MTEIDEDYITLNCQCGETHWYEQGCQTVLDDIVDALDE